jgi:hypothetical protein
MFHKYEVCRQARQTRLPVLLPWETKPTTQTASPSSSGFHRMLLLLLKLKSSPVWKKEQHIQEIT